ncbi:putative L-ascorbate peroxidase 3 peroxisomal [Bienertia sinuspersici]
MGRTRRVKVDADYLKEIERACRDLRALISTKQCAPIMLRLANHHELSHTANKGLHIAVDLCGKLPITQQHLLI